MLLKGTWTCDFGTILSRLARVCLFVTHKQAPFDVLPSPVLSPTTVDGTLLSTCGCLFCSRVCFPLLVTSHGSAVCVGWVFGVTPSHVGLRYILHRVTVDPPTWIDRMGLPRSTPEMH